MWNELANKAVNDIIAQAYYKIEMFDTLYNYSKVKNFCHSNYLFFNLPGSNWAQNLKDVCEINDKVACGRLFEEILLFFDQILQNISDVSSWMKLGFCSFALSIIPKNNFKPSYPPQLMQFLTDHHHDISLPPNFFQTILRLVIMLDSNSSDFYLNYITKGVERNLDQFVFAAMIFSINETNLRLFLEGLNLFLDQKTPEDLNMFVPKLSQFWRRIFLENPRLFEVALKLDNIDKIKVIIEAALRLSNGNIIDCIELLSALMPFGMEKEMKLAIFSNISDFQTKKNKVKDLLNSFVLIFQNTMLTDNPDTESEEFIKKVKPKVDEFLFNNNTIKTEIMSGSFVDKFLVRYIALDLASSTSDDLPPSVSSSLKSEDFCIVKAVINALKFVCDGYPKEFSKVKNNIEKMVNPIFNLANSIKSKKELKYTSTIDHFHQLIFDLISGYSSKEFSVSANHLYLNLISEKMNFINNLFLFINNKLLCISKFSNSTIVSFIKMLYSVFDDPKLWVNNLDFSNFDDFLYTLSHNFQKMLLNLLPIDLTLIPYTETLFMHFIKWIKYLCHEKGIKIDQKIINSIKRIILLISALFYQDDIQILNDELKLLADSLNLEYPNDEKIQTVFKDTILLPIMKEIYVLWHNSTFYYLQNQFPKLYKADNNYSISTNKFANVSFSFLNLSIMTSFLCKHSSLLDQIQLQKYEISQPSQRFFNCLIEFLSNDFPDLNDKSLHGTNLDIINAISKLDQESSLEIMKIVLSKLNNTYIHHNCISAVAALTNEGNKTYTPRSFDLFESIILNMLEFINMDTKYKDPANQNYLNTILNLILKVYTGYQKINEIPRLTMISIILNFAVVTMNDHQPKFISIIQSLPILLKNFKISAENLSPSISDYENQVFVRKTISCIASSICLVTSTCDEASLLDACQECIQNILFANFGEAWKYFVGSFFTFPDVFKKIVLKSFITVIKSTPEVLKANNLFAQFITNDFQLIKSINQDSIKFFEAAISIISSQFKHKELFISMCNEFEKVNQCFFIAYFKITATQKFIKELSIPLFEKNLERTISAFSPPIQFAYYWQLCVNITKQQPVDILFNYFICPLFQCPQLYSLKVKYDPKSNDIFLCKLRTHPKLIAHANSLMKTKIEYFEFFPIPDNDQENRMVISHFLDPNPLPGNFLVNFKNADLDLYTLINSQALVCINKDQSKKDKWVFTINKLPKESILHINESFAELFPDPSIITLYIDMRNLPKYYLQVLRKIFASCLNIVLIFVPIGVLKEIESKINHEILNANNIKIQTNVSVNDAVFSFHISSCLYQIEGMVNGKQGSINFFQENIIIMGFEQFMDIDYPVMTSFTTKEINNVNVKPKKFIQIFLSNICSGERVITIESPQSQFIAEAIERTSGSLLGTNKFVKFGNFDPKTSLLALSLLDVPIYGSIVSETSLELFWLLLSGKESSLDSVNALSLPLDGLIHALQEKNVLEKVVLFLVPFLSFINEKNVPMLFSLFAVSISNSKDESFLSGICYNLISQFNNTQSKTKNEFQLLYIWSVVKNDIFTKIAIQQIAAYVEGAEAQSKLIYCLATKNSDAVNEFLIENLIHNDLTSFHCYKSLFSKEFFTIFPSIQYLGKEPEIIFLSLVAALSAPKAIAQPFIITLSQYLKSKSNEPLQLTASFATNSSERFMLYGNDFGSLENNLDFSMFEPEKNNIYETFVKVMENLSPNIRDDVYHLFQSLTQEANPKVFYLRPDVSDAYLLNTMANSIVPDVDMKKISFCLASLIKRCDKNPALFWASLPFLQSAFSNLRIMSMELARAAFSRNSEDPIADIMNPLSQQKGKNLSNLLKVYGMDLGLDFEGDLLCALAESILISLIDSTTRHTAVNLSKAICSICKYKPEAAVEHVLSLIAFGSQYTGDLIQPFKVTSLNVRSYIKEVISKSSPREVKWIIKFLVWCISQDHIEQKFSSLSNCLLECLHVRSDVGSIVKLSLLKIISNLIDKKEGKDQEQLCQIAAAVSSLNTSKKQEAIDSPFPKVLEEMHAYSYCINFYNGIIDVLS